MANHKSALKRIRQTAKRNERNRYWRSTLRTSIKSLRAAIDAGDKDKASELLNKTVSTINRVASKGVIHKAQASRRVSRLMAQVNRMGQQDA